MRLSSSISKLQKSHFLQANHFFYRHGQRYHAPDSRPSLSTSTISLRSSLQEEPSNPRKVFDEMPDLNVVSATAIIGRFVKQNRFEDAIYLFSGMLSLNIRPNEFTFGTVIQSSTKLGDVIISKQLHACAMKVGVQSNVFVGSAVLDSYTKLSTLEEGRKVFEDTDYPNVVSYTTLISGYLRKGRTEDALLLFKDMPERNVVSWNAMIGGYSQTGHNEEAVRVFTDMLREGMVPNQSTFPCVISAAANIAALGMGKSFHGCATKCLGFFDVFVSNSLISFYAKCGSMEDSLLVFDQLRSRNIVSWNAVIFGYAHNGRANEAISVFERMKESGIRPNGVSLLGLLLACNHVGLVKEGLSYFNQARLKSPTMVKPEHYASIVDLLARSGCFKEAEVFVHDLPFNPGLGFWKALLGGCQIHSNMELGMFVAEKILELDPGDVSSFVMLSNAHSAAGRWQCASRVRREMKEKGMIRVPGCSWIEIKDGVTVFVNGDRNHPWKDEIYAVLTVIIESIKQSELFEFQL